MGEMLMKLVVLVSAWLPKLAKSRTILANVAMTVASVLTAVQGLEWVQQHPQVVAAIGVAWGFVNMVLRAVTTKPLSQK